MSWEFQMADATEAAGQYEQLQQRAHAYVLDHGGRVAEDRLISYVFGSSGSSDLWRPLLRQVLNAEDRLTLRPDGCWAALDTYQRDDGNSGLLSNFVVFDVETTGLRPYQHRMIEFGAVRYRNGTPADRYSTLINPERPLPAFIRRLTGIDDTMLISAPTFARVADAIMAFLGEDLLIGYNVGFDNGFLAAELKRLGRPAPLNETLDASALARALLPDSRARGLESLARELKAPMTGAHRALVDAETTGMVIARLLERAEAAGVTSSLELSQLAQRRRRSGGRCVEPVGRGRAVLDREHVDPIPQTPGVYMMRDQNDRVIYVGKAKNLRARVRSYYSQPLGYTRKMDGLLQAIARIETVETGSELRALLLEAQLIQRYRPQFNRQLRNCEAYPYIKIDVGNPWPRISLAREPADDGATYFGPYRSASAARETVEALNSVLPLRTCTRGFKNARSYGSPCAELDFGRCLGPCTGQADRDAYKGALDIALRFLLGDPDPVFERLHEQLETAAERLDFERAARLRNRIKRVQDLIDAQNLLNEAVEQGNALVVMPAVDEDWRTVLMVSRGRPWAEFQVEQTEDAGALSHRLRASWERAGLSTVRRIDQHMLDAVQIVGRWIRKYHGHPAILTFSGDEPDWTLLAQRVQSLSPADLEYA
jgi:DNA polymerase III subunit epsilon